MIENEMRPVHPGEILREPLLAPQETYANALVVRLPAPLEETRYIHD